MCSRLTSATTGLTPPSDIGKRAVNCVVTTDTVTAYLINPTAATFTGETIDFRVKMLPRNAR